MRDEFTHTISDANAPERLRGLVVKAILTEARIDFEIDMPDDPTPNELAYLQYFTGELMSKIRDETGIGFTQRPIVKKEWVT